MRKEEIVAERLRRDWAFTPLPSAVLRDKDIPDAEKITYTYLVDHAGTKGKCWVSQAALAKSRGKGLRTIERHISFLKRAGLIQVTEGKRSADTLLVDINLLYTNPRIRYKASPRIPAENDGGEGALNTAKNGGSTPAKNGGHKKREQVREKRKPVPTELGALPSGKAQADVGKTHGATTGFLGRACTKILEVMTMTLNAPRNRRDPKSIADRKKTPPSQEELEASGIGYEVDPDGNSISDLRKGKERKPSKTKQAIYKLWPEWKIRIKAHFHITIPGGYPVGSDYGHLKNILNYAGTSVDYAVQILDFFFDSWEKIKERNPIAERLPVPTLHVVDALKAEIHACIQTNSKYGGDSSTQERSDKDGLGVNRHQGGWEDWEKRWTQKHKE
jgi:hypothetical protein